MEEGKDMKKRNKDIIWCLISTITYILGIYFASYICYDFAVGLGR